MGSGIKEQEGGRSLQVEPLHHHPSELSSCKRTMLPAEAPVGSGDRTVCVFELCCQRPPSLTLGLWSQSGEGTTSLLPQTDE